MKNLIILNMTIAVAIIVVAILDLLFLFVLDYPPLFLTLMTIIAIVFVVIGGFISWRLKVNSIVFEENIISKHIGVSYLNEYSTLIASVALLLATYLIGYVNIVTIGAAWYTILASMSYLKAE